MASATHTIATMRMAPHSVFSAASTSKRAATTTIATMRMAPRSLFSAASTSKCAAATARSYATAASPKDRDSTVGDNRLDLIRRSLYPTNAVNSSPTPTGAYHPQMLERLQYVMAREQGSEGTKAKEVHETINRAWSLHQKQKEKRRVKALQAKQDVMREACEALRQLAVGPDAIPSGRRLYEAAMTKPNPNNKVTLEPTTTAEDGTAQLKPKRGLAENKFFAARIGGLFPREMPVPTETWKNGERWDYEWRHPDSPEN